MPLMPGKSKKAMSENIKTEMAAGKPQKQSIAIAYAVQKKNKKKKMALGGAVETPVHPKDEHDGEPGMPAKKADNRREPESEYMGKDATYGSAPPRKPDDERLPEDEYMANHFAKGGNVDLEQSRAPHREVHPMDLMSDDERATSIADAIMAKRSKQKYADGGMVDLERNSEEEGSTPYDHMNGEAGMKEQYDDSQLSKDPTDSNEHADPREDDESDPHDMISAIRRKMRAKGA